MLKPLKNIFLEEGVYINMASIEKNIWDYLIKEINNPYGVAGLMGNIYAESGMIPNRVDVLCLTILKEHGQVWNDSTYTAAVDN